VFSPGCWREWPAPKTPVNAVDRRTTPYTPRVLARTIANALPLLMRERVLEAVLAAQALHGGPVTAQQARAIRAQPVMSHARAFTEVAWQITRLGPDEYGRVLCAAGKDRKGLALWWVEERRGLSE
jgi:hypothetical protein